MAPVSHGSNDATMKEWNVVISVYQQGYRRALRALRELGQVERSTYHNVLVMTVDDPLALLDALERRTQDDPALYDAISRIAPGQRCFDFKSGLESLGSASLLFRIRMSWRAAMRTTFASWSTIRFINPPSRLCA